MRLPDKKQIKDWVLDFRRDVIRMMRLKFICMAMAILIGVFLVMLTAINMIMNTVSQSQSMTLLRQIAESERYNSLEEERFHENGGFEDMPPDWDGSEPPLKPGDGNLAEYAPAGLMPLAVREPPGFREETPQNQGEWATYPYPSEPEIEDDDDDDDDYDETDDDFRRDDDRRPPWERRDETRSEGDFTRPSEDVPPPWATDFLQTEPPAAPAPTDPPPTEAPPAEPVTDPEPAPGEPVPADVPADVTEEITAAPDSTTAEGSTAPAETETTETVLTDRTEPPTEPPTEPKSSEPPVRREPRLNRWNVSVTIDHFAIFVGPDGNYLGMRNTEDYTDEEAQEIMAGILAKSKNEGMYGWLQFCTAQKSYGTLIVVTDKTSDQGLLNNLFRTTVIIGIIMLIVLLAILIFVSRWITMPVQQAFKRQKQFVSDAGHELKTPIAVLTTNADILQDEIGENKWLVYMQEQIGRMNQLVGDLLRLARMDNATQEYTFADFDLSMAVAATTLPFESSAFEQHKTLEMDVQPGVHYRGSEQHIRQLCAIFIDNALKYSSDNGLIKVTLLQRGDHQILEFYNTGCEISQAETEKIFERFYRGDKARNSTKKSGYGLGLAIAKSIMDVHKIKFQVTCEQEKWIRFLLTF